VWWTYEVENTGTTKIAKLDVQDSVEGAVSCPVTSLASGETTICVAHAQIRDLTPTSAP